MRVRDYMVVSDYTLNELERKVNSMILSDWVPQGGICHAIDRHSWQNERKGCTQSEVTMTYSQAMILYYKEM